MPDATPVVLIGGPLTSLVDAEGRMDAAHRRRYETLIEFFSSRGWGVLSAHREEGWGSAIVSPEECTSRDYEWMLQCDLFVAFPGAPASPGTHVEIGWASAMKRPMILLLEEGHTHAFLVTGIGTVATARFLPYREGEAFLGELSALVEELAGWPAPEPA